MPRNSLLDTDFENDDDLSPIDFGEDQEVVVEKDEGKPKAKGADDFEIEVVDDTPEPDKGKKSADELPANDDEDDEILSYGDKVRKRIAKETAKVHSERRAKEDRERQLNEAVAYSRRIIEENNRLKALIENGEKVLMNESTGRLDGQIAQAKAAYRDAVEAGDVQGQLAAQENLAKAVAEKDRLSTFRPQQLARTDEKELERFTAPAQQVVQPDQRALEWRDKNPWFGRDDVMTNFAMGYHAHLVNREGILPQGEEYWSRLNKEMRTRFPEKFQNNSAARRSDVAVAPAVRNGNGPVARKVTLTESQVRLAKRLGLTPKQYAEQMVAENGEKEWVHGK